MGHTLSTKKDIKNLDNFLIKNQNLNEKTSEYIYTEIFENLSNLHALGIYHSDFKPGNMLIDEEGQITIIDLGDAQDKKELPLQLLCTPLYAPYCLQCCYNGEYKELKNINSYVNPELYALTKSQPFTDAIAQAKNNNNDEPLYAQLNTIYKRPDVDYHALLVIALLELSDFGRKMSVQFQEIKKGLMAFNNIEINEMCEILANKIKEDQITTKVGKELSKINGFESKLNFIANNLIKLKRKENELINTQQKQGINVAEMEKTNQMEKQEENKQQK